jgi:hypothetical protein
MQQANSTVESKSAPAATLAELCAELVAVNWWDEPKAIRTSRGDFALVLDVDAGTWLEDQVSCLQFDVNGTVQLGDWELTLSFCCSEYHAPPTYWDTDWPAARRDRAYGLRFSELEAALKQFDWAAGSPSDSVELAGLRWERWHHERQALLYDLSDRLGSGHLMLQPGTPGA